MPKKLTPEKAASVLADIPPERSFYFFNGPVAKNLEEFAQAMGTISKEQYLYHRNREKNDFYNWVLGVIKDSKLANELALSKSKETSHKKIAQRAAYLRKILGGTV